MQNTLKNKLFWIVFAVYAILCAWSMTHHGLWSDEVHSWNIAKGSSSFGELLTHSRYEGHPPGWYSILWIITRFTHQVIWMQLVQWTIACSVIFLILFYAPFPTIVKVLIPFGYYFLFEYATFSRNYGIGVLLVCGICLVIRDNFRLQPVIYYALLFSLFNIHLIAIPLACSLHLYYLLLQKERRKKTLYLLIHALIGGFFLLMTLWLIYPPADSALLAGSQGGLHTFDTRFFIYGPLRSFLPVPAWWMYHFWNTQFLLDATRMQSGLKFLNPLIAITLIASAFFLLWPNRKCLALFGINLLLSGAISIAGFSLTSARYAGYLYIGFIAALWLYSYENQWTIKKKKLVILLTGFQLMAGIFAIVQTIRFPFSDLDQIKILSGKVPAGHMLVSDYWTMNAYSAFVDKPIYCIDLQKEKSYIMWDSEMAAMLKNPYRYSSGLLNLFHNNGVNDVYMISQSDLGGLSELDAKLPLSFDVDLIDKKEGAIEKGSNLYLYKISEKYAAPDQPQK
jgi:hypothetical protein